MTDNISSISQHFRDYEQPFIQQVLDWMKQADDDYRLVLTRFLNPREQYILQTLINRQSELQSYLYGGVAGAESQRAIIAPEVFDIKLEDFGIALLTVQYPQNFATLHHATILGTLMHLGISRDMVGDILFDAEETSWQIIVEKKMVAYIQQTVTKIGRVAANLKELPLNEAMPVLTNWQEQFTLMSSLRLDVVISSIFQLSRSDTKTLIESGQVHVNWMIAQKTNMDVAVGDLISVRKHGRAQIKSLDGRSKKDKLKAIVNVVQR
ncbi:YlmH family RNA-binding protein [Leuconostoc pseudomesenteroides]|uniref:YlmH family RNA-binding protein n=1 Tax=Leuconostoc pseudomesenteroides TaxID=33968 RepID=UPI0011246B8D|nr:YlmH/Sll1252 family protein [Leuconostoc pseudomesenteroides]TOZ07355.1 cell division protein [Leuconostoc pseudomesenteroides]